MGGPRWPMAIEGRTSPRSIIRAASIALQGVIAEDARAVARLGDRAVDGGEDVAAGGGAEDLQDRRARHFFRRHVLHLPRIGDGLELADGEEAVLAGVGADHLAAARRDRSNLRDSASASSREIERRLPPAPRSRFTSSRLARPLGRGGAHASSPSRLKPIMAPGFTSLIDRAVLVVLGTARRARQEEQQPGVREADGRLREQRAATACPRCACTGC